MVAEGRREGRGVLAQGAGRGLIPPRVPQALLDNEEMEMLRSRRRLPLSTSTFDYSAYHSLDEVRKRKIWGILG